MVSVIVPIYNVSRFLVKFLDSLYAQDVADMEFVFVDDCSTDDSLAKLGKYVEAHESKVSVRIFHNDCNMGLPATREIGYAHSKGEYLLHLDPDDWISPGYIEGLLAKMSEGADVAICDYYVESGKGSELRQQIISGDHVENLRLLIEGTLAGNMWNKMFRRSFLERHCVAFSKYNQLEDLYYSIQVFSNAPVVYKAHTVAYHYRLNPNSLSFSRERVLNRVRESLQNFNEMGKILREAHYGMFAKVRKPFYNSLNALRASYLEKTPDFSKQIAFYDFPRGIAYVLLRSSRCRAVSKALLLPVAARCFCQYRLFHYVKKMRELAASAALYNNLS